MNDFTNSLGPNTEGHSDFYDGCPVYVFPHRETTEEEQRSDLITEERAYRIAA